MGGEELLEIPSGSAGRWRLVVETSPREDGVVVISVGGDTGGQTEELAIDLTPKDALALAAVLTRWAEGVNARAPVSGS